jgi:hypothetical protein
MTTPPPPPPPPTAHAQDCANAELIGTVSEDVARRTAMIVGCSFSIRFSPMCLTLAANHDCVMVAKKLSGH